MKLTKRMLYISMIAIILAGCSSVYEEETIHSEQLIYGESQGVTNHQIEKS